MITTQCAICEEKESIHELYKARVNMKKISGKTFSARRTPDSMHYRFVKCNRCGLIFSNPILPLDKISNFYEKSTFDYSTESNFLKKTYGFYLQKILPRKRSNLRLLDIGCGNGFFLEEAKALGIGSVYGIEPGKASAQEAPRWLQKNIKIEILEKGIFPDNSFDIICCFHTLDHIVDPSEFLTAIFRMLKKDGKVLFIVHDTDGMSVKLFGEKSPIFDIEHVYLFNKKTLPMLFAKNKFTVQKTFPVKNTYPLSYWMRMMPLPFGLKKSLIQILKKTKFFNVPISLRAGNIGIIARK